MYFSTKLQKNHSNQETSVQNFELFYFAIFCIFLGGSIKVRNFAFDKNDSESPLLYQNVDV